MKNPGSLVAIAGLLRKLDGLIHPVHGRRDVEIREAGRGQSAARLVRAATVALARDGTHLRALRERLDALDPRRVLARGYALLTGPSGHAVTSVTEVTVGTTLRAELADGSLGVAVTRNDPRAAR